MRKLVIVDDNPLERNGLRNLIDWESIGIAIVGDFRNGKHALEHIPDLEPDIVLTDIQMPIMNGIELTKRLNALQKRAQVVFMSSYEHFEYARSAVTLGVEEYILKPVHKDDLLETFGAIVKKLELQEQARRERDEILQQIERAAPLLREQLFRELLFHGASESAEERLRLAGVRPAYGGHYCVGCVELDGTAHAGALESVIVSHAVKSFAQAARTAAATVIAIELTSRSYAVAAVLDSARAPSEDAVVDLFIKLQEHLSIAYAVSASIGISTIGERLGELPRLYAEASEAIRSDYLSGSGHIVLYRLVRDESDAMDMIPFGSLHACVREALHSDEAAAADRIMRQFVHARPNPSKRYIEGLRISLINSIQLLFIDGNHRFKPEASALMQLSGEGAPGIAEWIASVIRIAKTALYPQTKDQYDRIVDDITAFVQERYHEPLTLQNIADAIYLSPSHMNNIFKAKMGKSVFDYLIELRIEAAKRKLINPYSKIYLVAQEVGYANKSHFCQVFKKYTGATPSEFKHRASVI